MGGMVISRDTTRRYSALAALCESLMLPSLTSLALTVPGFTNEPMSRVYTSLLALHRQQLASLSMVVGRTHYLDTRMMLACGYPNLTECTLFGVRIAQFSPLSDLVICMLLHRDSCIADGRAVCDTRLALGGFAETSKSIALSGLRRRNGAGSSAAHRRAAHVFATRCVSLGTPSA